MDPIVKAGSEKLTAADVADYLERHPEASRLPSILWRDSAALEAHARRAQHTGDRSDFEPRADGVRTDVR